MSDEEPKIEVAGHLESGSDFVQARTVLSSKGIAPAITTTHPGIGQPKILEESDPGIIVEGVMTDTKVVQARQVYNPEGVAPSCVAGEGTGSRTKIVEPIMCPVKSMVRVRKNPIDEQGLVEFLRKAREESGKTIAQISEETGVPQTMAEHWFRADCPSVPNPESWEPLKNALGLGETPYDAAVTEFEIREGRYDQADRAYHEDGVSPALTANGPCKAVIEEIPRDPNAPIMWPSLNGPTEIEDGDGVVPTRPYSVRKSVMKNGVSFGIAATATPAVAVEDTKDALPEMREGDVVPVWAPSYRNVQKNGSRFKDPDEPSFAVLASMNHGVALMERSEDGSEEQGEDDSETLPDMEEGDCVPVLTPGRVNKRQNGRRFKNPGEPAFTVTTVDQHGVALMEKPDTEGIPTAEGEKPIDVPKAKLRIRYLTPRECLRLMDFTDEQIDRLFAVEKSKSQLYKMAGNSIVVGVLVAIFKSIYIDESFAKPVKRVRLEDFL